MVWLILKFEVYDLSRVPFHSPAPGNKKVNNNKKINKNNLPEVQLYPHCKGKPSVFILAHMSFVHGRHSER